MDDVYKSVIIAGTHLASSMKVAEAAKVIENTQRDINIAFVNELSMIFEKMDIDTHEVLKAAGTKWNFLDFRPGLVGGHCIGVDPYYLTLGYNPQVILSGRRINDNMGAFVANKVVKLMIQKGIQIKGYNVLVMGITFKENCPDIRNSRVIDVISELREFGCEVDVHDPLADHEEVKEEYGITLAHHEKIDFASYDSVILAVAHDEFKTIDLDSIGKEKKVLYDVKNFLPKEIVDARL